MMNHTIILFSIIICSVLVILLERTPVRRLYAAIFKEFGQLESAPPQTT